MSLGIYIQVPFCQTKCTYCNFHTGPAAKSIFAPYARAVAREIEQRSELHRSAGLPEVVSQYGPVDTIYLGGGTPSLLDPVDVTRILDAVRGSFACVLEEVTLEADPETITTEKAGAWLQAGVNRISLGVQSFHDQELAAAGRMHRRRDIFLAAERLRAAGFTNLSIDLIAGLPHQTAQSWEASLDELLMLRPQHVSIYLLEVDEGSRLGKEILRGGERYGAADVPSDDDMAESYEQARARLAAAGYEHYEISNWGLKNCRSWHNLKYWRREPYLGFGAGAHSFDGQRRWANAHDPAEYVVSIEKNMLPIEQREEVSATQALDEEMFLGLRQLEGVDLDDLERRYKSHLAPRIGHLVERGLLERDGPRVRLAPARLTTSNEVFVELLG
jgi:oxygen-independent coproporphyrinogen-3 oxidase